MKSKLRRIVMQTAAISTAAVITSSYLPEIMPLVETAQTVYANAPTIAPTNTFIGSVSDWNTFAQNVADGVDYSGKNVVLSSDIGTINTIVGTQAAPFTGNLTETAKRLHSTIMPLPTTVPRLIMLKVQNLTDLL